MDWKFCTQLTHKYNNWSVVSANCLEMKLTWNFQLLSSDILRLNSNSLLLHFSCTIFCEDEWHFRESNATETGCEVILEWKSQRLNAIAVWCSPWPFAFELIALSMGLFPGYFIFFYSWVLTENTATSRGYLFSHIFPTSTLIYGPSDSVYVGSTWGQCHIDRRVDILWMLVVFVCKDRLNIQP